MFTARQGISIAVAVLGLAIVPASASAVSVPSTVSGTVATELSLSIATPAAMNLTHATPGSSSSVVTVTSTNPTWTLSIVDTNGGTSASPGHMNKVGSSSVFLQDPLQWSSNGGSTWNNLSGTAATVGTGTLVGTKTVNYQQSLGASEGVTSGDSYTISVTYTAT
jgi:hypothetical protein